MNQQAATIAASVLSEPVEPATRCEDRFFKATQLRMGGGYAWSQKVRTTALPRSFILAVTRSHVHVLQDKRQGDDLVAGRVVRSWDRASVKARRGRDSENVALGVPGDQQILYLFLPPDAFSDGFGQEFARRMAAAGRPGAPHRFVVAKDAPTERVIDALGATGRPGSPGPNITIGGQSLQDVIAQAAPAAAAPPSAFTSPHPSAAQRLQELETLRVTGVISDAEYTRKREQIISEI